MYSCAFAGHRPERFSFKYNEKHPLCKNIKMAMHNECKRLYEEENIRTFYTGCARGVDLWGAEAVLHLRDFMGYEDMILKCVIPFPDFSDRWPFAEKVRLKSIFEFAGAANIIKIGSKYEQEAYKKRNYFMVDNSEYLVAVFDNLIDMRSGTKQTYYYALKKKRSITLIHPDTAALTYLK